MRLSEVRKNRGYAVARRDHRNDLSTPEVPKGHPKRREKTPRKRIDHKHVWIEEGPYVPPWWSTRLVLKDNERPRWSIAFKCSVLGCKARMHKKNPRYGYELHKYRKKGRV